MFLATSGHSGVDRAARNLLPELVRQGYAVDLLKVRRHGPELDVPLLDGLRVIDLGHRHVYSCIPALARYLRHERPSLLLSGKDRVNRAALFAAWLSGVRRQLKLVFWIGSPVSEEIAHKGWLRRVRHRFWMRRLYPHADQFLADSPGIRADLVRYTDVDPQQVRVVPHAVIPESLFDQLPARPNHPWLARGALPLVLAVGELSDRKDYPTLLRAFAELVVDVPAHLLVIGRGKRLEALRDLSKQLGIPDQVEFLGFRSDVYGFIAHADLLAHAAISEGLGFVLIEALACGTPVVATDCPTGPRAVLRDGQYGSLVPVRDFRALARAMQKTLEAPLDANLLREGARPYAVKAAASAFLSAFVSD